MNPEDVASRIKLTNPSSLIHGWIRGPSFFTFAVGEPLVYVPVSLDDLPETPMSKMYLSHQSEG
ncbi:Hypothetical protein FKW44_014623 [Caligus rogercresseyi]|uniref:Uncharacterized protein n=1 Tax=Caligus rogercresseyi TaxID=217165 RepID=A0A7T8JZ38_CALRO|nr:Hypothetical protein FKW44_014623 [Caligus rogercresseyi]